MKRRTLLRMTMMIPWLGACTGAQIRGLGAQGVGMVVEDKLAPGSSEKRGVQGVSDTGRQLFAHARLTVTGGGTSSYGGTAIPRWVRVTWREGPGIEMDWKHGGWKGGTVVGDYTVPVLERIPTEAFELVRTTPDSALKLRFRIKDDGVLFGWAVEQHVRGGYNNIKKGGDFTD